MASSSSEATPLLTDATLIVTLNAPTTSEEEASLPTSAYFTRTRRIISIFILIASTITVILIVPTRILIVDLGSFNHNYQYYVPALLYYTLALIYLVCPSLHFLLGSQLTCLLDDVHVRSRRYQSHMEFPRISQHTPRHLPVLQDSLVVRCEVSRDWTLAKRSVLVSGSSSQQLCV